MRMGGPVRSALQAEFRLLRFLMPGGAGRRVYAGCLDCLEAVVVALLLPAKNKRNQPSLPLVRLHQE
jgi:hypothetical protein